MIYTIFLQQLLYGIIALLFTYTTGKLIASFFKIEGNFFFRLFVTYIIGITSIVIVYSIIKAHGRTVNILLLPIIGYLLYYFRDSFTKKPIIEWKEIYMDIFWSLVPFLIVFFYQSWFYFDFGKGMIKPLFADFYLYPRMSDSLRVWGMENGFAATNYFFPENQMGVIPYHYPELWLNAFWSFLFVTSSTKSLILITFTILISIYIIGICSLFRSNAKFLNLLISLMLLFVPIISFNYIAFLPLPCISGVKFIYIYIFGLLSYRLIIQNNCSGYIILVAIPIFSIAFVPSVFGVLFLIFSLSILRFNHGIKRLIPIVFLIFIFFCLLSFYYFFSMKNSSEINYLSFKNNPLYRFQNSQLSVKSIKIVIGDLFYYSYIQFKQNAFPLLLGFVPYVLLTIISYKKSIFKIWGITVSMLIIISVLLSLKISNNVNSIQLMSNVGVFCGLSTIIGISFFINNREHYKKNVFYSISIILFLVCSIKSIIPSFQISSDWKPKFADYNYYLAMNKLIKKDTSIIMTFLHPDYNMIYFYTTTTDDIFLIPQISDRFIIYTLGNPNEYFAKRKMSKNETTFYNDNKNPLQEWISNKKCTIESFIKYYNIKYFYFQNDIEIPYYVKQNIDIKLESPVTHSKFIIIK